MDELKGPGSAHASLSSTSGSQTASTNGDFDLEAELFADLLKEPPGSNQTDLVMGQPNRMRATDILFAEKPATAEIPTVGSRIVNGLRKGLSASIDFMEVAFDVLAHAGQHSTPGAMAGQFFRGLSQDANASRSRTAFTASEDDSEIDIIAGLERKLLVSPQSANIEKEDIDSWLEKELLSEMNREPTGTSQQTDGNHKEQKTQASSGTKPIREIRRGGGMSLG